MTETSTGFLMLAGSMLGESKGSGDGFNDPEVRWDDGRIRLQRRLPWETEWPLKGWPVPRSAVVFRCESTNNISERIVGIDTPLRRQEDGRRLANFRLSYRCRSNGSGGASSVAR
ncbi:hypothetical protein OF83DRAFT_1127022 [Amylostereum chailletii]|nr:hypothetical protein OF83DRAFT_1127022 [Amylostereum chailletii]